MSMGRWKGMFGQGAFVVEGIDLVGATMYLCKRKFSRWMTSSEFLLHDFQHQSCTRRQLVIPLGKIY
jgi:hypothetical protein